MRKRTLCNLTEVYQVATINPWSNTAITFNASDEPKFRTAREPTALVLSPIVDGFRLTKVLMDGGSGLNLIYEETLQRMEIDWSRIEQSTQPLEELFPAGRHDLWEKSHSMWYSARCRIIGPKR